MLEQGVNISFTDQGLQTQVNIQTRFPIVLNFCTYDTAFLGQDKDSVHKFGNLWYRFFLVY